VLENGEIMELGKKLYYSSALVYHYENQKNLLKLLTPLEKRGKILDIGCGDGSLVLEASKISNCEAYGIDIDEKGINKAKKRNINGFVANANLKIPFNNETFNVIISNQCIEHLENPDHIFSEIYRLLDNEGYAIISVPNISSFHNMGMIILGKQPFSFDLTTVQIGNPIRGVPNGGHKQIFTIPALKELAELHGFKVEEVFSTGHYLIPVSISNLFSKIIKRYSIFIGIKISKKL
jgi:methionine biosynthesis protein MetW